MGPQWSPGTGWSPQATPTPLSPHHKDSTQQAAMQGGSCSEGARRKEHCPEKGAEGVDTSNGRIHGEVETDV